MTRAAAFRGQPLLLLAALLAGWIGLRVATWRPPFEAARELERLIAAAVPAPAAPASQPVAASAGAAPASVPALFPGEPRLTPYEPRPLAPAWSAPLPAIAPAPLAPRLAPPLDPPPRAVGHSLLLALGLTQLELAPALAAYLQGSRLPATPAPALAGSPPHPVAAAPLARWSGDGWLLLRRDTTTPLLSGRPSYGRSQAGAVIRYALAPASPLRPQAHVRASAALSGTREQELAAGLSARPVAGVPLRVVAEARVGETDRGTQLRPAAYAVTEFPPLALPLGARGEAYVQGGYVGGEFATAFVDGQARLERPLARLGEAELSAGAGAWGGAQKGSSRLDVGPTAALTFRLGRARGRLAADYRFRVAGEAEPASGPALTISAGF